MTSVPIPSSFRNSLEEVETPIERFKLQQNPLTRDKGGSNQASLGKSSNQQLGPMRNLLSASASTAPEDETTKQSTKPSDNSSTINILTSPPNDIVKHNQQELQQPEILHLELPKVWRITFLVIAAINPAFYVCYAVTGKAMYEAIGFTTVPFCISFLVLFFFSCPREWPGCEYRKREKWNISAVVFICFITNTSGFIGNCYTDPNGKYWSGIISLSSTFHATLPIVFVFLKLRRQVALLEDEILSEYIKHSVFISGLSAIFPILYTTLESFSCLKDAWEIDPDPSLGKLFIFWCFSLQVSAGNALK